MSKATTKVTVTSSQSNVAVHTSSSPYVCDRDASEPPNFFQQKAKSNHLGDSNEPPITIMFQLAGVGLPSKSTSGNCTRT